VIALHLVNQIISTMYAFYIGLIVPFNAFAECHIGYSLYVRKGCFLCGLSAVMLPIVAKLLLGLNAV